MFLDVSIMRVDENRTRLKKGREKLVDLILEQCIVYFIKFLYEFN